MSLIFMSSSSLQISFSQGPDVNSSKVNGTLEIGGVAKINASSSMDILNATETTHAVDSKYEAARDQFLKVWDTLEFHPIVATFVNESAKLGNGVYQEHSSVFKPGETMALYVQPVGFLLERICWKNFWLYRCFTRKRAYSNGSDEDCSETMLWLEFTIWDIY